mgnify:CR=1 FL=1
MLDSPSRSHQKNTPSSTQEIFSVHIEIAELAFCIQATEASFLEELEERCGDFVRKSVGLAEEEDTLVPSPTAHFITVDWQPSQELIQPGWLQPHPQKALFRSGPISQHDNRITMVKHPDGTHTIQSPLFVGTFDPIHHQSKVTIYNKNAMLEITNFIMSLLPHLLLEQQGLLLHSSGLVSKGKAFLFTGPSGAGKTTAVRNSPKRQVLSDEMVIIKWNQEGKLVAYGTFMYGDWNRNGEDIQAPVEGIHFLKKSQTNRIEELGMKESFRRLCQVVCFRSPDNTTTGRILHLVEKALPYVKALDLQADESFWSLLERR